MLVYCGSLRCDWWWTVKQDFTFLCVDPNLNILQLCKLTVIICSYLKWLYEFECHKYNFSTKVDLDKAMAELKIEEYSNKGPASGTDLIAASSNISPSTDNNPDGSGGKDSEEKSCDVVSMSTRCKLRAHFQKHRNLKFCQLHNCLY